MTSFQKTIAAAADSGFVTSLGGFATTSIRFGFGIFAARSLTNDAFVRFTNIDIPKRAQILRASLWFTAAETLSGDVALVIYGDDSDNATAPVDYAGYWAKTRTAQNAAWEFSDQWAINTGHTSPDIGEIVRHIMGRPGWAQNNALQFFLQDNSSSDYRNCESLTASLSITYALSPLTFYLCPHPCDTIFTARVNGTPIAPYINIPFDTGIISTAPVAGQTVWFGSTAGGTERGKRRLRSLPTGTTAGTLVIDESDDVGPYIQDDDYITIKEDIRLWPRYPRFAQSGEQVTIYQDYDVAWNNQTSNWWPVAVAGPPGVGFLEAGQAQIDFVGDRSFTLADGASISSYYWQALDSVEGTSTSQGTEASPVTFTWTAPGWYRVSLTVTDSNGNSHTSHTWAIIINPADPTASAYLDFDTISDNLDFEQGGGECSLVVHGDSDISEFPEEAMVVHAYQGDLTTTTGVWPNRENVLFVGWILADTVRQDSETADVSFRAGTIDQIMRNITMFPVSLSDKTSPTSWTEGKLLTVDRAASFLWQWGSTLANMTPIIPTDYTGLIRRQDFGPGNIHSQLQSNLMQSIFGKIVCNHQGVLYHLIDYNLQNASERALATTRKMLHKGVWINDVTIEERADYTWPVNQVKSSGVHYPGGEVEDVCPIFSEAPGDAPKSYGKEANFDRLIVLSQSDLNVRTGHALAKLTERYHIYRMQFINEGSFIIAPQELFPTSIEATDNERDLSFSGNLIPRRIGRTYDHAGGFVSMQVDFEPETEGNPGITVDMPCGPPEQEIEEGRPPDPPRGPEELSALATATEGSSFYFAQGAGEIWQRRISGLGADQLAFLDMKRDPWSTFKQGYNPNRVIVWGCGAGFLVRSEDSGQNWTNRTPYLSDPPNVFGDATGTAAADLTLTCFDTNIFTEDEHYILAEAQGTGSAWRGWLGKTDDGGFNWEWAGITGSAQARPLRVMIDQGNGQTAWVTTWEDDWLYLRKYNTSDLSLAGRYEMGACGLPELNDTYRAFPFARLGQASEIFVFGRMSEPQLLSDPTHILYNDADGATGSWSVIEDEWGGSICGDFWADEGGNYYAVRNVL